MKWKYITLTAAGIFLIVFTACEIDNDNEGENNERVRLIPVETIEIIPDSFDDFIRVSGVVEAIEDATVSAENSGLILSIRQRGEYVQKGEVIANMDARLSRAQFEAAKTSFELADDSYQRLRSLYEDEIISTQDYKNAKAQRDQAKAQMEQAEKQLSDTHIEAPFNGRIEERFVRTGELINPGMPVVRLVNTDLIRMTAGIPERYSGQIREGSPVYVRMRNQEGRIFDSVITFAGNVLDSATRTFPIEIEYENSSGVMKSEMVVDLRIKRATIENAIIVPRNAIVRDEDGTNLYRVREANGVKTAELVPVSTGFATGSIIEITEGIRAGDEVVISGMSTLSDGDRLNILITRNSNDKARELQRNERPGISFLKIPE
jgi:membrane fusion protein, multidrug efflux system